VIVIQSTSCRNTGQSYNIHSASEWDSPRNFGGRVKMSWGQHWTLSLIPLVLMVR